MTETTIRSIAVSYTHLDVYKRKAQPYVLAGEDVQIEINGDEPLCIATVANSPATGMAQLVKTCSEDDAALGGAEFDAVSYTHLDVYKRQPAWHDRTDNHDTERTPRGNLPGRCSPCGWAGYRKTCRTRIWKYGSEPHP